MESELDLIDSLNALNYAGSSLQNEQLTKALDGGIRCAEFRELVCWLTQELHVLRKTDESVSPEVEDASEFAMELSSLLKELGCPYHQFVAGPLSDRFESRESRLNLLDYLVTELMATRMSLQRKPVEQQYIIPKFETNTARVLEQLCKDLELGKPPENIAPKALFDKLNFKIEDKMRQAKPGVLSTPLMKTPKLLSQEQWKQLEDIQMGLDDEYNLRRQVLLTRLDVTVQSFQWSDQMKSKEKQIADTFQRQLKQLEELRFSGDETNIVALLAARADLAIIEKTSSANVRKNTASKIQKHVIGSVPDRGGRASEHAPPPPEMPFWQQQRASGPQGGGGGRGGGRGGRGGGGGGNWQSGGGQQRQQFEQRPQFEQQQQGNRDQVWISGSGRVQGSGWVPGDRGGGGGNQQNNSGYQGGRGDGRYDNRGDDRHNRGEGGRHDNNRNDDNSYRGRSNYNRGGGGGGGGYNRR